MTKLAAHQALQLVLEHDAVVDDAVELELAANGASDLRRAGGDEIDADHVAAAQRGFAQAADQGGDARRSDLVLRLLERNADHVAQGIELALEVSLVEIPAADQLRSRKRWLRTPAQQGHCLQLMAATAAATSRVTPSRTDLAATFTALAIDCALERRCAFSTK